MKSLVAAEVLKLRTTRSVYGMLAAMVTLSVFSVVVTMTTAGHAGSGLSPVTSEGIESLLRTAGAGSFLVLILGITGFAGEVRHNTLTTTLLLSPSRARVLGAKMLTYGLVGALFAVVASAVTVGLAAGWLRQRGVSTADLVGQAGPVLAGVVVTAVLFGVLGVGLGALVRNQLVAVVLTLAWLLIVETLIGALVPEATPWLLGGAVASLQGGATSTNSLMSSAAGGAIVVYYSVVFGWAGRLALMQRDVA